MFKGIIEKIIGSVVEIIIVITIAFFLSFAFFTKIKMQGFSMEPYIKDEKILFVDRLYPKVIPIKRFDCIAFNLNDRDNVKRVIGLPGEIVEVRDGKIFINGEQVENKYIEDSLSFNMNQITRLLPNEYYVMGDNLDSSRDSRFQDVGNIKRSQIIGKVWFIMR